MSSNHQERFVRELVDLFEATNGSFHIERGVERLGNRVGIPEDDVRASLQDFADDDGIVRASEEISELIDDDDFEGSLAELTIEPGDTTGERFRSLPILEPKQHPLIPNLTHEYFERDITDDVTDVDVLCRALADADFSPLLVGDAGTGKDVLVDYVCARTNRPRVRVNFGSDVRYENLVGMHVLTDEGSMEWRDGLLTAAVRHGWVFVADELNAAPPEATMPLHQVTEEESEAGLVIREESELVEPHDEFRFVATMNPPRGGYGGAKQLNDAFKSRFYSVHIDYLDADREAELIDQKINDGEVRVPRESIENLCELAASLRSRYRMSDIITPVTTRELIKACKMADIMSLEDATRMVLVGHAKDADEVVIKDVVEDWTL